MCRRRALMSEATSSGGCAGRAWAGGQSQFGKSAGADHRDLSAEDGLKEVVKCIVVGSIVGNALLSRPAMLGRGGGGIGRPASGRPRRRRRECCCCGIALALPPPPGRCRARRSSKLDGAWRRRGATSGEHRDGRSPCARADRTTSTVCSSRWETIGDLFNHPGRRRRRGGLGGSPLGGDVARRRARRGDERDCWSARSS